VDIFILSCCILSPGNVVSLFAFGECEAHLLSGIKRQRQSMKKQSIKQSGY
jgi:hypothetical protein